MLPNDLIFMIKGLRKTRMSKQKRGKGAAYTLPSFHSCLTLSTQDSSTEETAESQGGRTPQYNSKYPR